MLENRTWEILIIALVVLLLFGAKRLPGAARSLGKSLRIIKAETNALREEHATGTGEQEGRSAEPQPLPSAPQNPPAVADPVPGAHTAAHTDQAATSTP